MNWNPWKDNKELAPWQRRTGCPWEKWYDHDGKKDYYYNPFNNTSQYDRPSNYESPEPVQYDSMDDDNNKIDWDLLAKQSKERRAAKKSSRRYQQFDPNAGGFSFNDLPNTVSSSSRHKHGHNRKHRKHGHQKVVQDEHDPSINKAVHGLTDILNGNIKSDGNKISSPGAMSNGSNGSNNSGDLDPEKVKQDNKTAMIDAIWKHLQPKIMENYKIEFQEFMKTHAALYTSRLDVAAISELESRYNKLVVQCFQKSVDTEAFNMDINDGIDSKTTKSVGMKAKSSKQTVWAQLDENLKSVYNSQNNRAIRFVIKIFTDDNSKEDEEKKARCLSILSQNNDHLARMIKSDRKGFHDKFTMILLSIMKDYVIDQDDEDDDLYKNKHADIDIDTIFNIFGYNFMTEYIPALIRHEKKNSTIIKVITTLSRSCIVYQLIACSQMLEILKKFNVYDLYTKSDAFDNSNNTMDTDNDESKDDDDNNDFSAYTLLAIEALKVIKLLTNGQNSYDKPSKDQRDLVQSEAMNNYIAENGFPLDALYEQISSILEYMLSHKKKSNLIVFGLCCNILRNIISTRSPIIFFVLGKEYKRTKRIIYFLHKTYTELQHNGGDGNKRKKRRSSSSNSDQNASSDSDGYYDLADSDDPMANKRKAVNRVIQPYLFKSFDDAGFDPYGVELDVSQREDAIKLSNIDCRESIGDLLLKYIQTITLKTENKSLLVRNRDIMKYKYLIGTVFYEALTSDYTPKVSWGYNKALNHYHRDNICIEWFKNELLYQHKLDGREHPNKNNQPQRHFRICSLIDILFDPLVWDYKNYQILLQKLCDFCIQFKQETKTSLRTWNRLQKLREEEGNDSMTDIELMNIHISFLRNEIVQRLFLIVNKQKNQQKVDAKDQTFAKLVQKLVDTDTNNNNNNNSLNINLWGFENMLKPRRRVILSSAFDAIHEKKDPNKNSLDCLISQFLRSQTLHLLVGLTQMEAKYPETRNCAQRAINKIVWSVADKDKKMLQKSQIPFLPTLKHSYETYQEPSSLIHTKNKDILVVGDGNLSFGRALSRLFGSPKTKPMLKKRKGRNKLNDDNIDYGARNIVVTCYESAMELLSRYPHSGSVVAEVVDRGGIVLYGIDATKLKETLSSSFVTYGGDRRPFPLFNNDKHFTQFKYDIIVWNFPHAMEGSYNPKMNGNLVENFMSSAKEILKENGEIHITLHINHQIDDEVGKRGSSQRQYKQYLTWGIDARADNQDLICVEAIELKHRQYPGYAIKNVQGNPFNIVKAETYIFKRKSEVKNDDNSENHNHNHNESIVIE